jgi:hypothetical protein
MLNVFTLANGRLFQEEIDSLEELSPVSPVWVDLEDPTAEEKAGSPFALACSSPRTSSTMTWKNQRASMKKTARFTSAPTS